MGRRFASVTDREAAVGLITDAAEAASYREGQRLDVFWWRSKGKGPVILKFGRHVRYPKRELRRWIETQPSGGIDDE
jgi:hypothetical protein